MVSKSWLYKTNRGTLLVVMDAILCIHVSFITLLLWGVGSGGRRHGGGRRGEVRERTVPAKEDCNLHMVEPKGACTVSFSSAGDFSKLVGAKIALGLNSTDTITLLTDVTAIDSCYLQISSYCITCLIILKHETSPLTSGLHFCYR